MYERHEQKYFAMLNNTVAVQDTPLEGGINADALAYYNYLLNLDLPDCPVDFKLPEYNLAAVKDAMARLIQIDSVINKNFKRPADDINLAMDAVIETMEKNKQEAGVAYLPAGWVGKQTGHFAVLKCRGLEGSGRYAFSVLNHGAGIHFHQQAQNLGSKSRYLYQSSEYIVDLNTQNGRDLLQRLIEIQFRHNQAYTPNTQEDERYHTTNEYSAQDLYGLLNLYGEEVPLTGKLDEKVVTPQRGGSCTITNTHAVARDILIENNVGFNDRKRYHFVLKLHSIIDQFEAYQRGNCDRNVLAWALKEFSVRVNKQYRNILSDEEVIYCGELHDKIQNKLDQDQSLEVQEKCAPWAWPDTQGEAPKGVGNFSVTSNKKTKTIERNIDVEEDKTKSPPPISPETLKQQLQEEEKYGSSSVPYSASSYTLLKRLPHCSGTGRDMFWSKVPKDDIDSILGSLAVLSTKLKAKDMKENLPQEEQHALAIALMLYDIAAELTDDGTYTLGLDDVYSELSAFSDPEAYHIVKHVVANFAERAAEKKRVLTNTVNVEGIDTDHTVHYFIHVLLNHEQRVHLKDMLEIQEADDLMFFDTIMKEINNPLIKSALGDHCINILLLSDVAHNQGQHNYQAGKYQKSNRVTGYHFNKNHFYKEYARNQAFEIERSESREHMPRSDKTAQGSQHSDFSENTIYHPAADLAHLQRRHQSDWGPEASEYAKNSSGRTHPYQPYPSGSINPDSEPWKPNAKDKQTFIELDEQLRQIACSPNLQIARTLNWLATHPDKLQYPEVRSKINDLIFQYGRLDNALANNFEITISQMSVCLSELITYIQQEQVEDQGTLVWIAQFATNLRNYAEVSAHIYNVDIGKQALPSVQESLLSIMANSTNMKLRASLAKQLLNDFANRPSLSTDDCALALVLRAVQRLDRAGRGPSQAWETVKPLILDDIKNNPDAFYQSLNHYLKKYIKFEYTGPWELIGASLTTTDADSGINLKFGELGKFSGRGMLKDVYECTEAVINSNKALFNELGLNLNNVKFFDEDMQISSSDGIWKISGYAQGDGYRISGVRKKITIKQATHNFSFVSEQFIKDYSGPKLKDNPFGSENTAYKNYQCWVTGDDHDTYFVQQRNSNVGYFYSNVTRIINQLQLQQDGTWQPTHKILLNLAYPQTSYETQWSARLGQIFGVHNIRCTASSFAENGVCKLEKIEHLILDLSFSVNERSELIWDAQPDFHLSTQQSIAAINGLPSLMIMENNKGERKFILPAFSLSAGEKNNAFNDGNLIDHTTLCHESIPYFEYKLNDQGMLVGESAEASLYLALIYRSQGDYKNAIHYLDRAKSYKNLSEATLAITQQALRRKIKSPLAAAFDLKLTCYLKEHQDKWGESKTPVNIPADWNKWVAKTQLPAYRNTFSSYRMGVSIIPTYCRLSQDEITMLGDINIPQQDVRSSSGLSYVPSDKRQEIVSTLPLIIFSKRGMGGHHDAWFNKATVIAGTYDQRFGSNEIKPSKSWRIYAGDEQFGAGFPYLCFHLARLLKDALSGDNERTSSLHKELYACLLNDEHPVEDIYILISLLLFASNNPEYFYAFSIPDSTEKEDVLKNLIYRIGDVFRDYEETFKDKKEQLVVLKSTDADVSAQDPLPASYQHPNLNFTIGPITTDVQIAGDLPRAVIDNWFDHEERPLAQDMFSLKAAGSGELSKIEQRLYTHYERGHNENRHKTKTVYKPKDENSLPGIIATLEGIREIAAKEITRIENEIIKLANKTPEDDKANAYNLALSRAAGQHKVITISDLFFALLQKDANLLSKENPFLTQEDVATLFSKLATYAMLSSRVAQIDGALADVAEAKTFADLKPYQIQLFASNLSKKRAYDLTQYPEFLVYEYATKRILRKDQVNTLIKVINVLEADSASPNDTHQALLQFAAGGGKTSVLIPILANRIARNGYLPVIFNTNELYETGLEDVPKNLRVSLGQNMEVIERDLEHPWSTADLVKLLQDLSRWRDEQKCLFLKPVTWHSINIARKLAYFAKDYELAQAADAVLDFFKHQTVKLEDESHIVSDPLQQSIKTFGQPHKVPNEQLDLLMEFYDHLMGYDNFSANIAELAGIAGKQKSMITPENLMLLQKRLSEKIADSRQFFGVNRENIAKYLMQASKERPDWLIDLHTNNSTTADLIILARAFIQSHLPHILTRQDHKDYGASIHPGDLTVAPKHEGKDVTSHFGDHILVAALTIQMYGQRGLSPVQVDMLLDRILAQHRAERNWNKNMSMRTEAELWMMQFNSKIYDYEFRSYKDITLDFRGWLSRKSSFYKNPIVVKRFLKEFALLQIEIPAERNSSTPAEMQSGFNRSLLLSATPGLPETYPATLDTENCFLEEAFEAQVIDTLLMDKNKQYCKLSETQTPAQFFAELPDEVLATMNTLIDRGALLTDFNPEEVVSSYLGLNQRRLRPTTTGVFFSKRQTHLKFDKNGVIDIQGTALVEDLRHRGIKPEAFLLFLFMDLSKTTGVDIKRPFHDVAGLTVGKEQTMTETIQAAMRQRQLLDENAQTVTWIMFQSLYREIHPGSPRDRFDIHELFRWMIKNEARQFVSKIINRAYQGIENEINALAWQQWRANPESYPEEYREKLRQRQPISPWDIYELVSVEKDSAEVLRDYRDRLLEHFGFKLDGSDIPEKVKNRIDKIIAETKSLIDKLQTPPKVQMENEVLQEMKTEALHKEEQEMEQSLEKNTDAATDFVFAVEKIDYNSIDDVFADEQGNFAIPDIETIKMPTLQFSKVHFKVIDYPSAENKDAFDHYKPIEMLLVKIKPDGAKQYMACTAAEADHLAVLLNKTYLSSSEPSYAIIGTNGLPVFTSNNTSAEACKDWIKDSDTQQMLAFANFISGRVSNPIVLSKLVKAYEWTKQSYEMLAETISRMVVSKATPRLLSNTALYSLCGWDYGTENHLDYSQATAEDSTVSIPTRALNPAKLQKDPGELTPTALCHERALEGYIFGKAPTPCRLQSEQASERSTIRVSV